MTKTTAAGMFGPPGETLSADGQVARAVRIGIWLRAQPGADFTAVDSAIRKIEHVNNLFARAESGAGKQAAQDHRVIVVARALADIEDLLVRHLGGEPDPRPDAAPPPPPPAPVARKTMTAEDAVSVSRVIYALHRHGVTFCVDSASGMLRYYDPRKVTSPEDRDTLRNFTAEARRVILAGHGLNLPSLPEGDATKIIVPHWPEVAA